MRSLILVGQRVVMALSFAATYVLVVGVIGGEAPAFAAPIGATSSDFDGDGYGDLAVASYDAGGAVTVLYGSPDGLSAAGSQRWTADTPGIPGAHDGNDLFGSEFATGDFNGDGFTDLAVANSLEDISGQTAAGSVTIIYGSSGGLTAVGAQLFSQDTPGIQGAAEADDQFGMSLVAGDVGNGSADDLVVGVPREDVSSGSDQGAVQVIFGSSTGLTATGNQLWTQDSAGVADAAEEDDQFGWSLAIGDFGSGSTADLAIGVPFEDFTFTDRTGALQTYSRSGVVHVLYGSTGGPSASGSQLWSQDTSGILETREAEDEFGWSLAAGDLGGGTRADLAIGSLGENDDAGAVNVVYGAANGLSATGNQLWTQDSPSIPGSSNPDDHFGLELEVGNVGNGAQPDLIVSAPDESFAAGVSWDGVIHVIFGSSSGLVATGAQLWSQASPGIAGTPETHDRFGGELEVNNYGRTGEAEIATGMMNEDYVAGLASDGLVQVIYGAFLGPTDAGNQLWSLDSPGVPGSASQTSYFGHSIG